MEEYLKLLQECLAGKRYLTKTMFKISATIYRGVKNGRFSYDDGMKAINELGSAVNNK